LRRFWPDTRQSAQRLAEKIQTGGGLQH
jgi:hypothetical protein